MNIIKVLNIIKITDIKQSMDIIVKIFFDVGNPWGQAIIYLIMGLFILGLAQVIYNFGRMYLQKHWLKSVFKKFESVKKKYSSEITANDLNETEDKDAKKKKNQLEKKKKKELDPIRREKELEQKLNDGKKELINDIPQRSVIAKRIENLFHVRYVGDLTYETLKELLFSEEIERTGFPRYLAGIFVLLGLAGTVLGLSQSVISIQPILVRLKDMSSLIEASKAIPATLAGMKTAFSTTIAGLIATILLTFINFLYGKYSTRFLSKLENFTTLHLIPYFLIPTAKEAAVKFADTMSESAEAFDKSTNPLLEVSNKLDSSADKLGSFMKTLQEVGDKYSLALDGLNTTQQELIKHQTEIKVESNKIITQMGDTLNKFQDSIVKLVDGSKGFLGELASSLLNDSRDTVKKMTEEYRTSIGSIVNDSRGTLKNIEAEFLQKVEHMAKEIKGSLNKALDMNKDDLKAIFLAQFDAQEKVSNKHKEVVNKYEDIVKMEREKISNIMKIYDLASLILDKTQYEEMMSREDRLINAMETVCKKLNEFISDLYVKSDIYISSPTDVQEGQLSLNE